MKLANLLLKTSQVGSNVFLKYVTPAEVMFLIADNHQQLGGDPVVKLDEISDGAEEKPIAALRSEIDKLETQLLELDDKELTEEIREKREKSLRQRIEIRLSSIASLERIQQLRSLGPAAEKQRLLAKYGLRLSKFYPGNLPTLPQTFEEARTAGLGASTTSDRLLTVGDQS